MPPKSSAGARAPADGMTILVPKSSVDGLAWPGLPGGAGTFTLALLHQLEQSQWWPPETLAEHQFRQLEVLVRHAVVTVPYYRDRFAAWGLDPAKTVTPEAFARIPILTRKEVQESYAALLSERIPKSHGKTNQVSSSGSTGMPIKVAGTELSHLFWRTFTLRDHLWHRRDLAKKFAAIRATEGGTAPYPHGDRSHSWGSSVASAYVSGPAVQLDITTPIPKQAEWLEREDPDYLLTFPSNLGALVNYCRVRGIGFPKLRQVLTIAEVLPPEVRAACGEAWGLSVADNYSANEVGYIALQCPDHEHLHVQAEGVLVEILDDEGRAIRPGEVGQVVITPLHNFAMPLIRYAVGDYAEVGEPCPCGRGLPVLSRVLGRIRNMVRLPNGDEYWPLFQEALKAFAEIIQCQIVQRTMEDLEIKLVTSRKLTAPEEERLRELMREELRYRFRIAITYHDEIPRGPGGKFEEFVSELSK